MKKNDEDDEDEGKNRPSAGVVVIIVVLLIVLIGGGGYGGYYFWHHRNDGATSNTNGPAIVTPSITPLFGDSFKNNNNNWDTNPPQGAKVTLAGDGKLVLESDNNSLFPEMVPGGKVFGDLRIDVDAGLTSGDPKNGYGIYIRASSNQNNLLSLYYRFEVYGDGSFVVYKGFVDGNGKQQSTSLVESPPSDALNHAGPTLNHLTVIAKGQALTLIANGTTVANFSDVSYKSGVVALFVSNVQHVAPGAQATFENFAIFPAQ